MTKASACLECGVQFRAQRITRQFCGKRCRQIFNNRRMRRGAELGDIVMAMRFDRRTAKSVGAWTLLCRMAARFRAEDRRDRNGRRSWDDVAKVRERNAHLASTVVGVNITGNQLKRLPT